MVRFGGAASGQDSALVGLEALATSVDGDGNGTLVDCTHDRGGVRRRFGVASCHDASLAGVVLAGSILSSVRIGCLSLSSRGLKVSEGSACGSPIATVIGGVAVNKLLRGESRETSSLDAGSRLERLNGGEGPARSTVALVLDWRGALASPVLARGELLVSVFLVDVGLKVGLGLATSQHLGELSLG